MSPDRRTSRASLPAAGAVLLSALGVGAWLRARALGSGGDPAPAVAAGAAAPEVEALAPPAVGVAVGVGAAPAGATLATVDGAPQAVEIVLPEEVCAQRTAVSLRTFVERRVGAAAAITGPRAPLALGPGCAAEVPIDRAALAAGRLRYLEVCAWGGARPRCAALHTHRWAPGAPPPEGLTVVGDRWRWAVDLPPAEPSPGSGCFAGTPGEIGGHELSLAQFSLAGRSLTVDLARPAAGRGAACALARAGAALETPAVGVGSTELASVLVQ